MCDGFDVKIIRNVEARFVFKELRSVIENKMV